MEHEFGYNLSRTCNEILPAYHHVESCQETVPQAIAAFLESADFEDALRTAVSLGGDSDTLAAITGSIAEAVLRRTGGFEAGVVPTAGTRIGRYPAKH